LAATFGSRWCGRASSICAPRFPRATAIAERAGSEGASVREVEYIRIFAKVAQVQFQAVLDALNEQVSRLGEVPTTAEPLKSD
jgi:hypothetical protein